VSQFSGDSEGHDALLKKLYPVIEVTVLIRPRLLLLASMAEGHTLMGILYHTRKDAFQSRLRFRSTAYPDFSRRTRWRKCADAQSFATWTQEVVKRFAELAVNLGAMSTLRLEFPPQASDDEIFQLLFASPLLTLLS